MILDLLKYGYAIAAKKEEKEKQERVRIDNKATTTIKKQKTKREKAEKELQAAVRSENRAKVDTKEEAKKQAQKKKEAAVKNALKEPLVKTKAPQKTKKVVRFNSINIGGGSSSPY